ncbi:hypothetical protein QBC44DRAFT_82551 [Cladorrhinum sp. PSN332]|nr:hypothetical protein QBC44DRAFT_82551 [Cladorrhinum sp. PSN332]
MTELSTASNSAASRAKRRTAMQASRTSKRHAPHTIKASDAAEENADCSQQAEHDNPTKSTPRHILPRSEPRTLEIRSRITQHSRKSSLDASRHCSTFGACITDSPRSTTPEQSMFGDASSSDTSISEGWMYFGSGALEGYEFPFDDFDDYFHVNNWQAVPKPKSVDDGSTVKGNTGRTSEEPQTAEVQTSQQRSQDSNCAKPSGTEYGSATPQTKQKSRPLACPFLKRDPDRYHCCSKYNFQKIKEIKQHLRRKHMPEGYICLRCQSEHQSEAALRRHMKQDQACEAGEALDGIISGHQKLALQKYPGRGKSQEAHWFDMWDIIFPNVPRPQSVYVKTEAEEAIDSLWKFWDEEKSNIIVAALTSMGFTKPWSTEHHEFCDGLMQSTLNQFAQKITKKHSDNLKQTHPIEEVEYDSSSSACSASTHFSNGTFQSNSWADSQYSSSTAATDNFAPLTPSTTYSNTFNNNFAFSEIPPKYDALMSGMNYSHSGLTQIYPVSWPNSHPAQNDQLVMSEQPSAENISTPPLNPAAPGTSSGNDISALLRGVGSGCRLD